MWTLKVKIYNKNFMNILANKYNITAYGYPLNTFYENNKFYVNIAATIVGSEKDKNGFIKALKTEKQTKNIDVTEDFVIACFEQPKEVEVLYSSGFIYLGPQELTPDFYQTYYLGSWDRKRLSAVVNMMLKGAKVKIQQFKKEKIRNISVTSIASNLTDKQKKAFKFAYENGYYNFPRDSDLSFLSKLMKISLSTYQAHLRKAEKKITDFFYKYIK